MSSDANDAQAAQRFYGDCVKFIMEGKHDEFCGLLQRYSALNPNVSMQDIFENYHSEGKILLHIAASRGNLHSVELILNKCINIVNFADNAGFTPIINATISESFDVMSYLIKMGADVERANNDGARAVHFAAGDGSVERLTLLREAGATFDHVSNAGSPLAWAAGKGHYDAVKYLIDNGVNLNLTGGNGVPPVFMAAVAASDKCVCALVEGGADIGAIITGSLTLLHICSEQGMHLAVKSILSTDCGKRLALVENDDGNLPVHLAAMAGLALAPIVEELIPYSAISNLKTVEDFIEDGKVRLTAWNEKRSAVSASQEAGAQKSSPNDNEDFGKMETKGEVSVDDEALADSWKKKGNEHFARKEYEEAFNMYSKALEHNDRNHLVWSNRSACALHIATSLTTPSQAENKKNLHEVAIHDAIMCRKIAPDWAKGAFRLASARFAFGMYEDAAVAAFEGCKLDDDNIELKKILSESVRIAKQEYQMKNKSK